MNKKKIFLIVISILYIIWVILMSAAVIRLYTSGLAYQAQGHPDVWIYTREKAAGIILTYLPVLIAAIVLTVIGLVLKIRDDYQDKPVMYPALKNYLKKDREAALAAGTAVQKNGTVKIIRIVILIVAVVFIISGILNGSMEDVLYKAINICTECVGLG